MRKVEFKETLICDFCKKVVESFGMTLCVKDIPSLHTNDSDFCTNCWKEFLDWKGLKP